MKKIIDGLKYDTEKSLLIGEGGNSLSRRDFNYCYESLYKTKSGRFFLSGEGGAMTKYSQKVDSNSRAGGSGIIPLSKEDALSWAENNLDSDTIEEHFKDIIEEA